MANAPAARNAVSLRRLAAKAEEVTITYAAIRPIISTRRRGADRD